MSESRIQSLDILKGIGILLVILCHTFMKEISIDYICEKTYNSYNLEKYVII